MQLIDKRGKIAVNYVKACAPECTYVISLAGINAGLYWMRVKGPNTDIVKRLTIIR
jgi:hypothetical protein